MTLRDRIIELTNSAKTQVDLDALVSRGILKQLDTESPGNRAEIIYEWEIVKNSINKMV